MYRVAVGIYNVTFDSLKLNPKTIFKVSKVIKVSNL